MIGTVKRLKSPFLTGSLIILLLGCSVNNVNDISDQSIISVSLKAKSGELNEVFIEVKDVQLKLASNLSAPGNWVSLNTTNQGVYNFYDLQENSKLLLVENVSLKSDYLQELKLVLGDENSIIINSQFFDFNISENGLLEAKNSIGLQLLPGKIYDIIIEFDIDESVIFNQQDGFNLEPKIYTAINRF